MRLKRLLADFQPYESPQPQEHHLRLLQHSNDLLHRDTSSSSRASFYSGQIWSKTNSSTSTEITRPISLDGYCFPTWSTVDHPRDTAC